MTPKQALAFGQAQRIGSWIVMRDGTIVRDESEDADLETLGAELGQLAVALTRLAAQIGGEQCPPDGQQT